MAKTSSWVVSRDNQLDEYRKILFDSNRLTARENVFKKITLPSLQKIHEKKASDINFVVNILTSTELPKENLDFLKSLSNENSFINVIVQDPQTASVTKDLSDYLNNVKDGEMYASVRLDDDDALSSKWLEELISYMKPEFNEFIVALSNGYAAEVDDSGQIKKLAKYKWRFGSVGLAYLKIKSESNKSIFNFGNHLHVDEKARTISYGGEDYFLRTFNKYNDSNCYFPNQPLIEESNIDSILSKFGL